jgi:hypothetical protein
MGDFARIAAKTPRPENVFGIKNKTVLQPAMAAARPIFKN